MVLSAQFWPSFREEKITLPEEMQKLLEEYTKKFEAQKGNRTLNWKSHLGSVYNYFMPLWVTNLSPLRCCRRPDALLPGTTVDFGQDQLQPRSSRFDCCSENTKYSSCFIVQSHSGALLIKV